MSVVSVVSVAMMHRGQMFAAGLYLCLLVWVVLITAVITPIMIRLFLVPTRLTSRRTGSSGVAASCGNLFCLWRTGLVVMMVMTVVMMVMTVMIMIVVVMIVVVARGCV